MTRIDEIKARLAKATGGEWSKAYFRDDTFCVDRMSIDGNEIIADKIEAEGDADLIAHAGGSNGDLAYFIRVVEAAKPIFDQIIQTVEGWQRDPEMPRHPRELSAALTGLNCGTFYDIYDALTTYQRAIDGDSRESN